MARLATIVVPIFNAGTFLLPMLESLWKQQHRPLKVVLWDDGSSDGSVASAEAWARAHSAPDFVVACRAACNNLGLCRTVSDACREADGDYIAFADQDDLWDREKLSTQIAVLEQNKNVSIAFCDRRIIGASGSLLCESEYRYAGFWRHELDHRGFLEGRGRYSANCLLARAQAIQDGMPIPEGLTFHDFYLALAATRCGRARFVHRPLLSYRIHSNNLSGNYAVETSRNFVEFEAALRKLREVRAKLRMTDAVVLGRMFAPPGPMPIWDIGRIERVPSPALYWLWKARGRVGCLAR